MKVRESAIPTAEVWHAFFVLHVKGCQTVCLEDHVEGWRASRCVEEGGNESWS